MTTRSRNLGTSCQTKHPTVCSTAVISLRADVVIQSMIELELFSGWIPTGVNKAEYFVQFIYSSPLTCCNLSMIDCKA